MWQTSKNIKTGRIQDKGYFERKQPAGRATKQVEELIIRESGGGIKYNHNYIYYIARKWGFKQKIKESTCTLHLQRGERGFQKKTEQIFMGAQYQKENFAIVSLDESFFSSMIFL
jgi:hypothetical protein